VSGIHHAHFWQMDERRAALDAHIVIAEGRWSEADAIKERIKAALSNRFDIAHTTLELECARHACDAPSEFGGRGHGAESGG
jgi:cobalt-zinc-cadmium efflux system protein